MVESDSPAQASQCCEVEGCGRPAKRARKCWMHYGYGTCFIEGCDRPAKRGRRCWKHYSRGICSVDDCGKPAKRGGLCWGHHEHKRARRRMKRVRAELQEPRGGGRDRAGLPRRTLKAQVIDAAIDLANADADGTAEAFEIAFERLRMAWNRHRQGELTERQPHTD